MADAAEEVAASLNSIGNTGLDLMSRKSMKLRIEKLSPIERKSFEKLQGGLRATEPKPSQELQADFRFEEERLPKGQQGELMTTAIVFALGLAAIKVLAIWLARDTKKAVVTQQITIETPNGSKISKTISIDLRASKSPEAQVLAEVNSMLSSKNLPILEAPQAEAS